MKKLLKVIVIVSLLLGAVLFGATQYAEKLLFASLNDEVKAATPCELKSDAWSVNLLTLSAYAKNARVECPDGKRPILIPEIEASFNLKKIYKNKIVIDPLILKGGDAAGLLPGSEGYAFINRLAAPSANPNDDGIKVRLEHFYVQDVSLTHQFKNGGRFFADNAYMHLQRHESEAVTIDTILKDISFSFKDKLIPIKEISSEIFSTDNDTTIKKLVVSGDSVSLNGDAFIELVGKENISGNLSGKILTKDIIDESILKGEFSFASSLKGNTNNPALDLTVTSPEVAIKNTEISPLSLTSKISSDETIVTDASIKNSEITFSSVRIQTTPLHVEGDVTLSKCKYDGFQTSGDLHFDVSEENNSPKILTTGKLSEVSFGSAALPPINIQSLFENSVFTASLVDDASTIKIDSIISEEKEEVKAELKNFTPFSVSASPSGTLSASGVLTLKNLLSTPSLAGELTSSINDRIPLAISLSGTFDNLKAVLKSEKTLGTISLQKNKALIDITTNELEVAPCKRVSGRLLYSASTASPLSGNGSIENLSFIPDCNKRPLSFTPVTPLIIKQGAVSLSGRSVSAFRTDIDFDGAVSLTKGYSLTAHGKVRPNALGILQQFDNVDGELAGSVKISGALSNPEIQGEISIKDGRIEQESSNLVLEEISGKALITPQSAELFGVTGKLNSGDVTVSGIIPLQSNLPSEIHAVFSDSFFQIDSQTSMTASGDLFITPSPLAVRGSLTVLSGDFIKSINLKSFLRERYDSLFATKVVRTEDLPAIPIDVTVSSPGNFFVNSNLLDAELKGSVRVTGTVNKPVLDGKIETVQASAGLRGRRFDVSLGEISFSPATNVPFIRIFGEASLMPAQLDSVLVLLRAEGPITKPSIEFISDRNLSQAEIVKLITGGQTSSEVTQYSSQNSFTDVSDGISINDTLPFFRLPSFLDSLTRIDSVSIEPRYDPYTGNNEPLVIARRRLGDNLELVGESIWRSTRQTAAAKLIYNLTSRTNLVGVTRTVPSRVGILVGGDVTFTVLSRRPGAIKVSINGTKDFSENELKAALSLNSITTIPIETIPLYEKRLIQFMQAKGYRDAQTKIQCDETKGFCTQLEITITEGEKKYFSSVLFKEEDPLLDVTTYAPNGSLEATEDNKEEIVQNILISLRNEGYVGARVKGEYSCTEEKECILNVFIKKSRPVSLVFQGARAFKEIDFLNTIRLFSRKTPLGSNTPAILVKNIEALYKEAGYPFIVVTRERTVTDEKRVVHTFTIEEGEKATIQSVKVEGISVDEEVLKSTMSAIIKKSAGKEFYSKGTASTSTIDSKEQFLKEALAFLGFENFTVSRSLIQNESKKNLDLLFLVQASGQEKSDCVKIIGITSEIKDKIQISPDCARPLSKQTLNSLTQEILLKLKNLGFKQAKADLEFVLDSDSIITIEQGPQSTIGTVSVSGNSAVTFNTIQKEIGVLSGFPYSSERLRTVQGKLLKLGLFQKVAILETDHGTVTDLEIELNERPLQTLEVGTGYSTGLGFHLFGEASDRELFSDGKVISLRLDTYSTGSGINEGIAALKFIEPSFMNSKYSFTTEASLGKQNLPTYEFDLDRAALGASFFRNFENPLTLSAGYQLLNENLNNVSPGAVLSPLDSGVTTLGILNSNITYDERDNPLLPTSGGYLNLDAMASDPSLGSDASYFGGNLKGSYSVPLSTRWSLLTAGLFGKKVTFGDTDFIPITQRYYLGGRGSVRGYKENSLGARGSDLSVIGGEEIMRGNFELHYKLYEEVSLQTFYDIGKVTIPDVPSDLDEFVAGTGIGLRYLSPIGPIGFDIAHGLDNVPGSRSVRVTFEIGLNF